jgi:hypothetical protein
LEILLQLVLVLNSRHPGEHLTIIVTATFNSGSLPRVLPLLVSVAEVCQSAATVMDDLVRVLQKVEDLWHYLYGRVAFVSMPILPLLVAEPDVLDEELGVDSVNHLKVAGGQPHTDFWMVALTLNMYYRFNGLDRASKSGRYY